MKKNNSVLRWFFSIVFLLSVLGFLLLNLLVQRPISRAPTITSHNSSVTPLWIRTDYFIDSSNRTRLAAFGKEVFIIGSASDKESPGLIALDAETGNMLWQYDDTRMNVLTVSKKLLFVGLVGQVVALSPTNGTVVWSTSLPSARTVTKLLVRDDKLYVDTVSTNHFVLHAETGTILQEIAYRINDMPNMDIPIWSDQNRDLEFAGRIMYFQKQTGHPYYAGEINAIEELSGNQIWNSGPLSAVTRMAVSPLGIFVLDLDGRLLSFSPIDGAEHELSRFVPPPVLRHEGRAYGYYVAIDPDNQLLFLYLGDSAQLFAFHIY